MPLAPLPDILRGVASQMEDGDLEAYGPDEFSPMLLATALLEAARDGGFYAGQSETEERWAMARRAWDSEKASLEERLAAAEHPPQSALDI